MASFDARNGGWEASRAVLRALPAAKKRGGQSGEGGRGRTETGLLRARVVPWMDAIVISA